MQALKRLWVGLTSPPRLLPLCAHGAPQALRAPHLPRQLRVRSPSPVAVRRFNKPFEVAAFRRAGVRRTTAPPIPPSAIPPLGAVCCTRIAGCFYCARASRGFWTMLTNEGKSVAIKERDNSHSPPGGKAPAGARRGSRLAPCGAGCWGARYRPPRHMIATQSALLPAIQAGAKRG